MSKQSARRSLRLCAAWLALATPLAVAQTPSYATPDWQRAAGGAMAFEVASIRPTKPGEFTPPNFALSADDSYTKTGGLFTADFSAMTYIEFAYKLWLAPSQRKAILATLPKWVNDQKFEIHARASSTNPTKDQMRLMMQSLLADRFKLAVHFEPKQTSVLALTLIKPGKPGPNLRPHSEGPPCDVSENIFPPICDANMAKNAPNHSVLMGSRNTTIQLLSDSLAAVNNDRPVIDQSGLTGRYDFTLEWTPEPHQPNPTATEVPPDTQGTSLFQAIKEQLGAKLYPTKATIDTLVIDRIELPSGN